MRIATLKNSFDFVRATRATAALITATSVALLLAGCGNRMDTEPLLAGGHRHHVAERNDGGGGDHQFSATVTDANGHPIAVTPTWSVVNGGGTITRGWSLHRGR